MSDVVHTADCQVALLLLVSYQALALSTDARVGGSRRDGYSRRGTASRVAGPPLASVRRPREEEFLGLAVRVAYSPRPRGRVVLPTGRTVVAAR